MGRKYLTSFVLKHVLPPKKGERKKGGRGRKDVGRVLPLVFVLVAFFLFRCAFRRIEVFCCIPLVHDMRHSVSDGREKRQEEKRLIMSCCARFSSFF